MNVIIRTDSSQKIGTGHVMRCLTLANALKLKDVKVEFICRKHNGHLIDFIKKKGFNVYELPIKRDTGNIFFKTKKFNKDKQQNKLFHSAWLGVSQQEDAKECIEILKQIRVDWLIVDHYGIDKDWQKSLSGYYKKLMVIDDLADRDHECDLLLDQNLAVEMETRYHNKLPKRCTKLIGPKYALLQPIYSELHKNVKYRKGLVKRVFVYFGGIDYDNFTGRILSLIMRLKSSDIKVDVVTSSGNPNIELIQKQIANQKNISLHINLPTLAHLMLKADFAIGASGATSWERLCLGLPSLVFTIAANQESAADELQKQGLIRRVRNNNIGNEFIEMFSEILENNLQDNWSKKCHEIVDGKGVERVCSMLEVHSSVGLPSKDGV